MANDQPKDQPKEFEGELTTQEACNDTIDKLRNPGKVSGLTVLQNVLRADEQMIRTYQGLNKDGAYDEDIERIKAAQAETLKLYRKRKAEMN